MTSEHVIKKEKIIEMALVCPIDEFLVSIESQKRAKKCIELSRSAETENHSVYLILVEYYNDI